MTIGKKLAISAVMGIIGAATVIATGQADARAAKDSTTNTTPNDKAGCGNHDGGKCGSMVMQESTRRR